MNHISALNESEAIAILTEWEQFRDLKWNKISQLKKIYDGRKIIQKGLSTTDTIYSIGS